LSFSGNQAAPNGVFTATDAAQTSATPVVAHFNPAAPRVLSVQSTVSPTIASRGHLHVHPVTNYRLEDVITDNDGRKYLVPKKEKWKALISRSLLISTGLLWLLVFYADDTPQAEFLELVLGMILLTIIPFMIGLLLELSYQRRKRKKIYIDA
jgi:hypothetical protein